MLLQKLIAPHRLLMDRPAVSRPAVSVVHFGRAVHTDPDREALRRQKATPLVIQKGPVGLDSVTDATVGGLMLPLECHDLAEIVQPERGWLSPMPGEVNLRLAGGVDVLDDIFLQQVVRHAEGFAVGIQPLLVEVVTVLAVQVADGTGRLHKDLELTRDSGHAFTFTSDGKS
jgi:hypothetical protein